MPSDDHDRARAGAPRRPLPFPTDRTLRTLTTGDDHAMHHRDPSPRPIRVLSDSRVTPAFPSRRAIGFAATTVPTTARTTNAKESTAMYSFHQGPNLHYAHAEVRRRDMLHEAEQARRLAQVAGRPRRSIGIAAMRRQVGAMLVHAGQRIQGVAAAEPAAGDPRAGVGGLRVVR